MIATEYLWSWVTTGSSNGLVPDGTKPFHEPVLTQIYVTRCHKVLTHRGQWIQLSIDQVKARRQAIN